jgi:hypothetical protein
LAVQLAMTALAVAAQAVVTRCPGPAVAHAEQAQVAQVARPVALHVLPATQAGRLQ